MIAKGGGINDSADMTYVDHGNGGWTFSVGSISFHGAQTGDTATSKLLWNVFNAAHG